PRAPSRGATRYLVDPPAQPAARVAARRHLPRAARHVSGQRDAAAARRGRTRCALFAGAEASI
ncbi:hypothetical protein AAHH79_43805, partial [Burkholderia pseudomallei]